MYHLPRLPERVDGVLLDELEDPAALPRLKRLFQLTARVPVIGALEMMPAIRHALEDVRHDGRLPDELIDALAHGFWKHGDESAIAEVARRRPFPDAVEVSGEQAYERRRRFRVAYAQDEAFGRYFPDTIEALEALGADLAEFSPLRDERLPVGADLVMIGCGMPDIHADVLASNVSMIAALRAHVCRGRRIYSEGGGTAYLGRRMLIAGRPVPGAGILPFDAELISDPQPPVPVTRRLLHDSWLGPQGTTVRGYKSGRWRLIPITSQFHCPAGYGTLSAEGDWFCHHHAVGSLLHLHLGALPEVVSAFAGPHFPSLWRPSPREQGERELDPVFGGDEECEANDPRLGPEV
jgi:cobyrinic acid a,c-diamide synthase